MRLAILDDYLDHYRQHCDWSDIDGLDVLSFRDRANSFQELVGRLRGCDAVMRIRERSVFDRRLIEALPDLRLILATGMRNTRSLDLAATDERGITVCTTDALHQSTVEVVWWLILSLMRKLHAEHSVLRQGGWQTNLGEGLQGKTLGVVGFGAMGQPVAAIGRILGMTVLAWSPNLTPERTEGAGVACVGKQALFERSDVISLHMPMSDRSRGIVDAQAIAWMKPNAHLINTSRAGLVDNDALRVALLSGRIGGAGLDVFGIEPLPRDDPFRHLPNVIATPHVGFVTRENMDRFFNDSRENLLAYLAGTPIRRITRDQPFLAESQVGKVYRPDLYA